MSTPVAQSSSSKDSEAEQTRNNVTCKFKYRIRLFYSKGAILVLLWELLIFAAVSSQIYLLENLYSGLSKQVKSIASIVKSVPIIVFLVSAPLCGWLADARFGKYKVFKTGSVIIFFAVVMLCVCLLVFNNIDVSLVLITVAVMIVFCSALTGTVSCFVTSLQLGLDQMPDASTANITSFIS